MKRESKKAAEGKQELEPVTADQSRETDGGQKPGDSAVQSTGEVKTDQSGDQSKGVPGDKQASTIDQPKPLAEYSTVELLQAAQDSLNRDKSEKVTAEVSEAQIHIRYALGVLGGNQA